MRRAIIAGACIALLAGCEGHDVGVGASVSKSTSASTETKVGHEQSVKIDKSGKAGVSMPAMPVLLDAMRAYRRAHPHGAHADAARIIMSTARPIVAWPVSCFGCAAQDAWARQWAADVGFANLVLGQLVATLPARALADPQAAQKAVLTAFQAVPDATLQTARQQAQQAARGRVTEDFSGGEGVHFLLADAGDYHGGPTGWVWSKDGTPWFGDGAIAGQKRELSLESTINTSTGESTDGSTTTGAGTEQGNSGDAGAK